jgi:hypothetical protein
MMVLLAGVPDCQLIREYTEVLLQCHQQVRLRDNNTKNEVDVIITARCAVNLHVEIA